MLQLITTCDQAAGIAGQSGRIAGDIDELGSRQAEQMIDHYWSEPCAGRIDQDCLWVEVQSRQGLFGGGFINRDMFKLIKISHKILDGAGRAFDADQLGAARGEEGTEQPDPTIEIEDRITGRQLKRI